MTGWCKAKRSPPAAYATGSLPHYATFRSRRWTPSKRCWRGILKHSTYRDGQRGCCKRGWINGADACDGHRKKRITKTRKDESTKEEEREITDGVFVIWS